MLPPPTDAQRKLLVLDLDETLVFSCCEALDRPADLHVAGYHVYKRPHLDAFLEFAFATFDVGVWTSSGALYAEPLVAQLMPARCLRFVWSAKRCSVVRNGTTGAYDYQKRLAKLKRLGYGLERIIGVDDTPAKYATNYGNLVCVSEYMGNPADDELQVLPRYLQRLAQVDNPRTVEKRRWREQL